MSFFKDWLFGKLNRYYHENDSYKDEDGKGLLERYLENIGEDIDDNVIPQVDDFLNILDPTTQAATGYKFLNYISYTLGSPPDIFLGDPAENAKYAKLVNHIISIYKIKGTKKSYELFFALLGYSISVIEYPLTPPTTLDSGLKLDDGNKLDAGCEPCAEYSIISEASLISGSCGPSNNPVLDPSLYPTMILVVKFLEPINAKLRSIISGGIICEDVNYCFREDITFELLDTGALDVNLTLDSGDTLDQSTVVSTSTITEFCSSSQTDFIESSIVSGTNLTLGNIPGFIYGVFVNGRFQTAGVDYNLSSSIITFTYTLATDLVTVVCTTSTNPNNMTDSATTSGTNFTLSNPPLFIYGVYVDGGYQTEGVDYTISGVNITFTYALTSNLVTVVYKT